MPERFKPEPAYDSGWNDATTGQDDDPLAELARLVQGVGTPSQPLVRPAPPRGEGGFRTPASRFAPAPSQAPAQQYQPSPQQQYPAEPALSDFDHTDLASDLEAELMRDLQDSFAAVRAPIEQQPPMPGPGPAHTDELDFDAFADMHMRQSNPMDASRTPSRQQDEQAAIESLASWREVKEARFKPKGAAPIIRPRNESETGATARAPERAAPRVAQPAPATDPLAYDPDIAAVAAVADSFARSPVRETPARNYESLEPAIMPESYSSVPGYSAAEHEPLDEDEYEPPRRAARGGRRGLVLVASLLGVVLIGTLAVFGFKGLSGGGSTTGEPPVIAADTGLTKIPATDPGTTASSDTGKLVYDRVANGDDTAGSSLAPDDTVTTVPRPESQSTEASREISRIILPDPRDPQVPEEQATTARAPSAEESAVGPKRVRTVVVRPDGTIVSSTAAPAAQPATAARPLPAPADTSVATTETTADTRPAPAPAAANDRPPQPSAPAAKTTDDSIAMGDDFEEGIPLAEDDEPIEPPPATRGTQTASATPDKSGPLSLLPKSGTAAKPAAAEKPATKPAKVAAVEPTDTVDPAPAPATASTGNYYVQISSQRSESAAADSYRDVQRKFPSILGNRTPDIRKADLGDKGIYYRARVSPGMSSAEANKLCTSLKSAGGDCIVTSN